MLMLTLSLDLAVLTAMGASGYYMYRLHRKMVDLRSCQSGLAEAVTELDKAVDGVHQTMGRAVTDAAEVAKDLGEKIDRADEAILRAARLGTSLDEKTSAATVLRDDLTVMGPSLERIAERLETLVVQARQAAVIASQSTSPDPGGSEEQDQVQAAEDPDHPDSDAALPSDPMDRAESEDSDDSATEDSTIILAGLAEARQEAKFPAATVERPYLSLVRRI